MRKKLLAMALSAVMMFSLAGCGKDTATNKKEEATPTPTQTVTESQVKTYSAAAKGMNADVKIEVEVEGDKILAVRVVEHSESAGISDPAIEKIPTAIVDGQTLNVDAISGCTITSNAILAAVTDALTQAGLDVNALKSKEKADAVKGEDVELTADVIVIGAGGAGLASAVSATQNGASVIVIEKQSAAGGNTIVSGGIYNCPDPELQEPLGIKDSPEFYATQTWEGGDKVANKELVDVLCYNAYDGLQWIKSLGVKFKDQISQGAGSLYQRTHSAVEKAGSGYIKAYLAKLDEAGTQILYNTKGEELIMDGDKVTGVIATGANGEKVTLHANKNVILATGGFAANVEMRQEYNTSGKWANLDETVMTTNPVSSTGDGIIMAQAVGANLVDMEQIQMLYLANPNNGSMTKYTPKCLSGTDQIIFINKEGERFVREDGRRDEICGALLSQTDGLMYIVESMDGKSTVPVEEMTLADGTPIMEAVEDGDVIMGDTLEDLATKLGCDPATLQATFDSFNASVKAKSDEFGRELYSTELVNGPFVATPRVAAVHHTMGGVQINTSAQVLDTKGNVIKGLVAAGEVTGGIHGANRLGGNALVDTVVFGKLAGETASK